MTTRTDPQPPSTAPHEEDDDVFWARAARYGFVRPDRIDPDQAWFWTREWIEGEIEVEIAKAEGRPTVYLSEEEFFAALGQAARDADLWS